MSKGAFNTKRLADIFPSPQSQDYQKIESIRLPSRNEFEDEQGYIKELKYEIKFLRDKLDQQSQLFDYEQKQLQSTLSNYFCNIHHKKKQSIDEILEAVNLLNRQIQEEKEEQKRIEMQIQDMKNDQKLHQINKQETQIEDAIIEMTSEYEDIQKQISHLVSQIKSTKESQQKMIKQIKSDYSFQEKEIQIQLDIRNDLIVKLDEEFKYIKSFQSQQREIYQQDIQNIEVQIKNNEEIASNAQKQKEQLKKELQQQSEKSNFYNHSIEEFKKQRLELKQQNSYLSDSIEQLEKLVYGKF